MRCVVDQYTGAQENIIHPSKIHLEMKILLAYKIHFNGRMLLKFCINDVGLLTGLTIDYIHNSYNSVVPYPTCTIQNINVHTSLLNGSLWDLWDRSTMNKRDLARCHFETDFDLVEFITVPGRLLFSLWNDQTTPDSKVHGTPCWSHEPYYLGLQ